ncbi:cytochrome P450 [Streptomyces sp. NPDC060027]|uniref:cytochrome P450 n=1 Tax=Streptomyces sp. NPDC060027 TaxID=3347040 RepID=UPI0036A6E203
MRGTADRTLGRLIENFLSKEPPADLLSGVITPFTNHFILGFLGLPEQHEETVTHWLSIMSRDERMRNLSPLARVASELVRDISWTSSHPGVLARLAGQFPEADDTRRSEIKSSILMLIIAGIDTTRDSMSLATLTLLREPEQFDSIKSGKIEASVATEELLRYNTVSHTGLARRATEDVHIAGRTIRKGDTVLISLASANWDERKFSHPKELNFRRDSSGHIAFGHGIHHCIGHALARAAMSLYLKHLAEKFPKISLACAEDELSFVFGQHTYGVEEIPVCWD